LRGFNKGAGREGYFIPDRGRLGVDYSGAREDITTHYSEAELGELLAAAQKATNRGLAEAPTLTVIKRETGGVGKLSETKKG
jgi:hypothetical protein